MVGEVGMGTVINVDEVNFETGGSPMGRIMDPMPCWVALSLGGMGDPNCEFLSLPLGDADD